MKILTNGKIVSDGKVLCGYDIVIKDTVNNNYILIKAELDDKYLDAVCIKHASKVIRKAGV